MSSVNIEDLKLPVLKALAGMFSTVISFAVLVIFLVLYPFIVAQIFADFFDHLLVLKSSLQTVVVLGRAGGLFPSPKSVTSFSRLA